MKYNPKSVRAGMIAKYLPNLYKSYRNCGNLENVVQTVKDFGVDNLNISDDLEKNLVKKLVFDCADVVLKVGIRHAYLGMPEIDEIKNPRTLPNFKFKPIFPEFHDVVDEFKADSLLEISGLDKWSDYEKKFVYKWHGLGKLPKQIAREYSKFCESGVFCDGTYEPFTDRSEMSVISFINSCYDLGTLKPQRINWEKNEDLAFAAHWISYLEKRDDSYKGYIKRTCPSLNDYFFGGDEKIKNRSLECFLKRDTSFVEKIN